MRSQKVAEIASLSENEKKAVALFIERLKQNFVLVKVILFGSKARGDYHEHSDVDLMVLVKEPKTMENRDRLSEIQFEVIMQAGRPNHEHIRK